MRKPFVPYDWSKTRIKTLVDKINDIKNDNLVVSPGEIWSIKKLLVLDYYVGAFVKIIRNNKFKNWYYVDTHCGSGLIGFKERDLSNERFPGSPLVVALRSSEFPFTDYIFSDEDDKAVDALRQRLLKIKPLVGNLDYDPTVRKFEKTVELVESKKEFGTAFLVFVDPTGFNEIKWKLMERLLHIDTADIIFTFMTPFIAWNKENALTNESIKETLNEFFGNDSWQKYQDGNALAELYKKQMGQFKKRTYLIPVYQTGERKLYDIIIATNSTGGGNVIDAAREIMDVTTTELFRDALKVVTGKTTDLTDYF